MDKHPSRDEVSDKLILLYILKIVGIPVSHMQLMKITLENRFMNYFAFQERTKELLETGLIRPVTEEDQQMYLLTASGINSLNFFEGRIPPGIKYFLENHAVELKSKILTESFISASILENSDEFVVNCKISENEFSLVDIHLTVGTRADAQLVCNNWKKYSQEIYAEIIEALTKKRKEA